jgi:hypothetical protein
MQKQQKAHIAENEWSYFSPQLLYVSGSTFSSVAHSHLTPAPSPSPLTPAPSFSLACPNEQVPNVPTVMMTTLRFPADWVASWFRSFGHRLDMYTNDDYRDISVSFLKVPLPKLDRIYDRPWFLPGQGGNHQHHTMHCTMHCARCMCLCIHHHSRIRASILVHAQEIFKR